MAFENRPNFCPLHLCQIEYVPLSVTNVVQIKNKCTKVLKCGKLAKSVHPVAQRFSYLAIRADTLGNCQNESVMAWTLSEETLRELLEEKVRLRMYLIVGWSLRPNLDPRVAGSHTSSNILRSCCLCLHR
jgi:hypothetical protein